MPCAEWTKRLASQPIRLPDPCRRNSRALWPASSSWSRSFRKRWLQSPLELRRKEHANDRHQPEHRAGGFGPHTVPCRAEARRRRKPALPPLTEQTRIVAEVERRLSVV